jgi:signal peptidase II
LKAKRVLLFILPAIVVIGFDRYTKHLLRTTPSLHHWTFIPGVINFDYTLNPGMAMGIDWLSTPVVSIISIIVTIAVIIYVFYTMKRSPLGFLFLFGMIIGGAIGNVIDRLINAKIGGYGGVLEGHVIDFIHFMPTIDGHQVFPYVFNVADASITIAIICLLIFNKQVFRGLRDVESEENPNNSKETGAVSAESKAGEKSL